MYCNYCNKKIQLNKLCFTCKVDYSGTNVVFFKTDDVKKVPYHSQKIILNKDGSSTVNWYVFFNNKVEKIEGDYPFQPSCPKDINNFCIRIIKMRLLL